MLSQREQEQAAALLSKGKKFIKYGLIGIIGLTLFLGSYSTVGPGERGIRITLGKTGDEVLGEGPHFKVPFVSSIKTMSIRIHKSQDNSEAATRDMQRVGATVALNWTINPDSVGKMLREVGTEESIENNIIAPAVSEVLKAATAKLTAEEVLTKRIELKTTIDDMLIKRLTGYGLIVKDISLVDLSFTAEFNKAVENKQIAEQDAKQAEYVALKATQDAKATVNAAKGVAEAKLINARAQAEGQKLLKQTLTRDVLQLEYLKKWDGKLPSVLTGNGGGVMLTLPAGGGSTGTTKTDESTDEEQGE